mgnify:CR=1 FL=1
MKTRILLVGKMNNHHVEALAEMYRRRIQHYVPINFEIVKAEKIKHLSDEEILQREGERILSKLDNSDYVIILDKAGKQIASTNFAELFNDVARRGTKRITFIVGGPLGLSEAVKNSGDQAISFSKMTFPHELAVVMLLEQIYRAQSILKGEKYHK